jgi:hypothetical protein
MKNYAMSRSIRRTLVGIGIYEVLLATNLLVAAAFTPIIFFMGSDANPGDVSSLSVVVGWILMAIFWIGTPLSFILNWYMVFSKKAGHPRWFFWLIPLPFLGLLGLTMLGLGLGPFIPFSFN